MNDRLRAFGLRFPQQLSDALVGIAVGITRAKMRNNQVARTDAASKCASHRAGAMAPFFSLAGVTGLIRRLMNQQIAAVCGFRDPAGILGVAQQHHTSPRAWRIANLSRSNDPTISQSHRLVVQQLTKKRAFRNSQSSRALGMKTSRPWAFAQNVAKTFELNN